MKRLIGFSVVFLGILCSVVRADQISATIPFSFDQLYPSTVVSRALNSLRAVWALAQELNENQFDADNVRYVWLELYAACQPLVAAKSMSSVMHGVAVSAPYVSDQMIEYLKTVWVLIGKTYDQIQLTDSSLEQFVVHMQIACDHLIDQL